MKGILILSLLIVPFLTAAQTYNILDFEAKGEGVFVNTKVINDAVNKCFVTEPLLFLPELFREI